jgi:hypothetical protein
MFGWNRTKRHHNTDSWIQSEE